jgi:hypothetical protein
MKFKFLLILGFPSLFFAQKKDSLSKFYFGSGLELNFIQYVNFDDKWSVFTPDYVEPDETDTCMKSKFGYKSPHSVNINYALNYSRKIKNSKFTISPRIAFSNANSTTIYQSWSKATNFTFDTLTSSNTGEKFTLDSIYYQNSSIIYSTKSRDFRISLLLEYQLANRLRFYSGIDYFKQTHRYSETVKYESEFYKIEKFEDGLYPNTNSKPISDNSTNMNSFNIKTNGIGIPLGLTFKLNKNDNLITNFYLNYEFSLNQIYYSSRKKPLTNSILKSHFLRFVVEF